jgi:hypothetical protein
MGARDCAHSLLDLASELLPWNNSRARRKISFSCAHGSFYGAAAPLSSGNSARAPLRLLGNLRETGARRGGAIFRGQTAAFDSRWLEAEGRAHLRARWTHPNLACTHSH